MIAVRVLLIGLVESESKGSTGVIWIQLFFLLVGKDVVLLKVWMINARPIAVFISPALLQPIGRALAMLRSHAD
jgi:hypothetical protein